MADVGETAASVLHLTKKLAPTAEARASVSFGRKGNTRFAAGEITTAGATDIAEVSLSVSLGKRHATATTSESSPAALEKLAERTLAMAKLVPEDPELMPVLGPQSYGAAPDDYDDATANMVDSERAQAARAVIELADSKQVIPAGFFQASATERALATSAGLTARHRSTSASFTLTVRTPDGTGSGWAGSEATRAADIRASELAATAIDKALRSRSPRALDPGEYTVVLEPAAVGDLLGFLIDALDARSADEGRSFFAKKGGGTRVGEKLFAPRIQLQSDPHAAATPGAPFDGEGLPLEAVRWIDHGKLLALRYSRFWAAKKSKQPTGYHSTFALTGGEAADTAALVKSVKKGLLVTRFWYIRWLEPRELSVTGLTRDGVFSIENGEVKHPVNNFRFNESPAKLLANCRDMTREAVRVQSYGGVFRVPALLADRFHMASVSAAV